ncbi:E3 ubiquitin-protein ligase NRDP1-like [Oppia nitens]|uniref:E3 ubiquitin-protein ligase NRDP1-like n=1 Tax=Oppia nitens TaxID=1686743 RepID=UPI0023D9D524|nr:E3 ubiquitin-protein ligase NRDP1-like [Oppia nitens]
MSDFTIERFVDTSDEELNLFLCDICGHIVNDPLYEPTHDCCYCRQCITNCLQDSQTCPHNDNHNITLDQLMTPMSAYLQLLNRLQIKCNNYENGCPDVLKLGDLRAHEDQCPHKQVVVIVDTTGVQIEPKVLWQNTLKNLMSQNSYCYITLVTVALFVILLLALLILQYNIRTNRSNNYGLQNSNSKAVYHSPNEWSNKLIDISQHHINDIQQYIQSAPNVPQIVYSKMNYMTKEYIIYLVNKTHNMLLSNSNIGDDTQPASYIVDELENTFKDSWNCLINYPNKPYDYYYVNYKNDFIHIKIGLIRYLIWNN